MILRRRVALDGIELDSVDSRILIQGIEPAAGKDQITAVILWGGTGSRVTAEHRDSLDIVVRFTINEKSYRPAERGEVLEKVCAWAAAGGWMTVNYKPDRRIRVICAQMPQEGDLASRRQYQITFRAYGVPCWQQENPTTLRITGTASGQRDFGAAGNRSSVMDIQFRNTGSAAVNTLSVTCGGSTFSFTSLGLASGETLVIDHPDNGRLSWLRIRIQAANGTYRSAMGKRTAGSANDLDVMPGTIRVSWSAGGAGTITFACAGRFG